MKEKDEEKSTESQAKSNLERLEEELIKLGSKEEKLPKGYVRVRIFPEPKENIDTRTTEKKKEDPKNHN